LTNRLPGGEGGLGPHPNPLPEGEGTEQSYPVCQVVTAQMRGRKFDLRGRKLGLRQAGLGRARRKWIWGNGLRVAMAGGGRRKWVIARRDVEIRVAVMATCDASCWGFEGCD
jgi:hypothetical protein